MISIYKETKTTGCVFEDGADTRETSIKFVIVSDARTYGVDSDGCDIEGKSPEDEYKEGLVSEYENQDYSNEFYSNKIMTIREQELYELYKTLKALDKEGFFNICKQLEAEQ